MPETPFIWSSLAPVTPEICLVVAICAILLIDVFAGERRAGLTSTLTLLALALSAALTVGYAHVSERVVILQGMYVADELAFVLKLAGFLVVAVALLDVAQDGVGGALADAPAVGQVHAAHARLGGELDEAASGPGDEGFGMSD